MGAVILLFVTFVGCAGDKGHTGKDHAPSIHRAEAEEIKLAALEPTILSTSRMGSVMNQTGADMRRGAPQYTGLEDGGDRIPATRISGLAKEGFEDMKYAAIATSGEVDVHGATNELKTHPKNSSSQASRDFDIYDKNNDGAITNIEYWKLNPRTAKTHANFEHMDQNDDGKLSKKEFVAGSSKSPETPKDDIDKVKGSIEKEDDVDTKKAHDQANKTGAQAKHTFEYYDRNKDGKIPNTEYWKYSPRTAETHYEFDRMDQNDDGLLTKKEFNPDSSSGSEGEDNVARRNDADAKKVAKRQTTTSTTTAQSTASTTTAGLVNGNMPITGIDDVWSGTSSVSVGWQWVIAIAWVAFLCSIPLVLGRLSTKPPPKSEIILGAAMVLLLGGGIVLFTNYVDFQSYHFTEHRSLTLVECVYFMSQVITTVGYGDITPANPHAQVFVGLYVIGALFVISVLFSRLVDHLVMAVHEYGNRFRTPKEERMTEEEAVVVASGAPKPLDLVHVGQAALLFLVIVSVWVIFFYTWPGENKTLRQCIYFSIITMSTVGFGAFTPVTEGGLIFAAFWMLFGSAALVNLISKFSCYVMAVKDWEQYNPRVARKALKELGLGSLNEAEFIRFCLVSQGLATKEELDQLKRAFDGFGPTDGKIRFDDLRNAVMDVAAA